MSKILVDEMPKEPVECPFSYKIKDVWTSDTVYYHCILRRANVWAIGDCFECVGCDRCTFLKEQTNE